MATWTTLTDYSQGELIPESWTDGVDGNLDYLLNPNNEVYNDTATATENTTTSTSFVDIDATNLSHTITTYGGPVLIIVNGTLKGSASGEYAFLDIEIDSTREGDTTYGLRSANSLYNKQCSFARIKTGLSAGSHTFTLQYCCSAGTAYFESTGNNEGAIHFAVIEI